MSSLFSVLKHKKKPLYEKTEEYRFYITNSYYLAKISSPYKLGLIEASDFKIIQANILIQAMKNKELYEENLNTYKEEAMMLPEEKRNQYIRDKIWADLDKVNAPYFLLDGARIYIPMYSKGLNLIYNDECFKLFDYPYNDLHDKPDSACIDCFDVYNYSLYDSRFTNLIRIRVDKSSAAFYHPYFETIYIINDQGRLDQAIHLFDRYIKNPDTENLMERIRRVVDEYYNNDHNTFIKALYINKFISARTFRQLSNSSHLRDIKKTKLVMKGKHPDEVL